MRRAKYSAKKVYLPRASRIGYGLHFAKPGNWITYNQYASDGAPHNCTGRVLGRIDETCSDGLEDCSGHLAVMQLSGDMSHSYVRWIDPNHVTSCLEKPPVALLTWIAGDEWPTRGADIPRLIAMAEHGTCGEHYIASRNDPDKPYNARPEYAAQFTLGAS